MFCGNPSKCVPKCVPMVKMRVPMSAIFAYFLIRKNMIIKGIHDNLKAIKSIYSKGFMPCVPMMQMSFL